jgi:hypothetical protein
MKLLDLDQVRFRARQRLAQHRFGDGPGRLRERLPRQLKHRRLVVSVAHADRPSTADVQRSMCVEARALIAAGISSLRVCPVDQPERLSVSADDCVLGRFSFDEVQATFAALAGDGLAVAAAHLHDLRGWPLDVVPRLLSALKPPRTRLFVHDYYALCTDPNLTFGDNCHCGAPPLGAQVCGLCRSGGERAQHLQQMARLLDALGAIGVEIIAPSQTAAALFARQWPEHSARLRVMPHQQLIAAGERRSWPRGTPRLGFIGDLAPASGALAWNTLLATPDLRDRFYLFHFGPCAAVCDAHHVDVDFARDPAGAMTKTLKRHRLDFALLWSAWPEAFSFSVYDAIAAGAYVLASASSGNMAVLVRESGRGRVFADFDELRRFLLDPHAVDAARAALARVAQYAPEWNHTLLRELDR